MFQSLSGFQVRCNFRGVPARNICSFGFNPYRVFKFAATLVQTKYRRKGRCFNPYRVFKFAATMTVFIAASNFSLSFNPYRVFKFAATAPFEWLFLAIILSKSQKLRPPGMNLFRTRPL